MGLQSKPTNLLPLTKCHFMTVVSITSRFRPDRFPKTCQVLTELNLLWTLKAYQQPHQS